MALLVDALPILRSSRFDVPLTYDAGPLELCVGDVVRVPLGRREVLAYVVRAPYEGTHAGALRPVSERVPVPRAFDEVGLHLARFVSERYICTLGEALQAAVRAEGVPRMVDRLVAAVELPRASRYPSVPRAIVDLIWNESHDGIALDALLRNAAARRAADRGALLRHVRSLVRSGDVRRVRAMENPRARGYRVRVLLPGPIPVSGKRARALCQFVEARPGIPRAEAMLAGFSAGVIARAVRAHGIVEEKRRPARDGSVPRRERTPPLTNEQRDAVDNLLQRLERKAFAEVLLHGVTAAGKTRVYIEAIARVVEEGASAIVLVPEIALTPQTAARFEAAFGGRVAVLHSALSDAERFDAWQACARGDVAVVVGARSAAFAPLPRVRLIVVDESHEGTYKQESVPRYHAVAVARERMRLERGVLLHGSATPALETYAAAKAGRIELIELRERASRQPMPEVRIVDLAAEFSAGNRRIFSAELTQALSDRLEAGEKSVLFMNRRGSARFMLCRSCGAVPECPRCTLSLAVHRAEGLLRCHYCDYRQRSPRRCPRCGSPAIAEFGVGTERVVEEVERLFPSARVLRMDSDSTTHVGDHARILREFEETGDVLVGTQMVVKGLDFPQVTLAGVVAADLGLHAPDFRAAERTFSLIVQACGRSGRASRGTAIVQTYSPEHPAIQFASRHDYEGFARRELAERRTLGYPPYARLVYLGVIGRDRLHAAAEAAKYAIALRSTPDIEVLGPAPYPIARVNNEWRYRLSLRSRRGAALRSAVRERVLPLVAKDARVRLAINVDP